MINLSPAKKQEHSSSLANAERLRIWISTREASMAQALFLRSKCIWDAWAIGSASNSETLAPSWTRLEVIFAGLVKANLEALAFAVARTDVKRSNCYSPCLSLLYYRFTYFQVHCLPSVSEGAHFEAHFWCRGKASLKKHLPLLSKMAAPDHSQTSHR